MKNAKVEIKDLANQVFTIKNNVELAEHIQSIDENKIKLKQINGGTEIEVLVPIEIKNEESIDIEKLQFEVVVATDESFCDGVILLFRSKDSANRIHTFFLAEVGSLRALVACCCHKDMARAGHL